MHSFNFFAERQISSYKKSDSALIVLVLLFWGIGIVSLYFCSTNYAEKFFGNPFYFVQRQLVSSAIGFVFMTFLACIDVEKFRKLLPIIVLGSIVLCIFTFVPGIGIERNGARRWIKLPYFSTFQPSEAIKFAMVLYLANLFDKQEKIPEEEKSVLPAFVGLLIFTLIIFAQQDFSTGLFVFVIGLILFFVTGAKLSWFIPFSSLGIPFAALMILLKPYRVNRLVGFFAQDSYQQTFNWQINNAKTAISDGGFWGKGIGTGLSKLNSVPEIQSDYIFAGWSEAMGLLGVAIYFILLGFFIYRIFKISMYCGNRFASIASFGFGSSIVCQSILNVAVVGGVLPSTGIPLPFFSSGGSSIVFTLAMCGFMINASRIEQDYESENYIVERIEL
ncbi:FtsW/RodA/SpoVE family cell cycle protein [Treponema pectinovorum]|uniref:FtsW/RodA/SpoVE family cell cycle protein n=1 Tax=Treponema pectinovorum TaxID=164 RepID=UPI0011C9ADFA|nr:putative peptidoglycan glycosyltransferase FtsW [Treponema pectinovorum]